MADNSTVKQDNRETSSSKFNFKDYTIEEYIVLVVFWILAIVVFAQFFSRYVLNSSIVWTEEMARYLLIAVGFLGSGIAAKKNAHIYVEAGYRFLPRKIGFIMSTIVDIIKIVFFGICSYLSIKILPLMAAEYMTSVFLPMSYLYIPVLIGCVMMTLRSIQVAWKHWKTGFIPSVNDPSNPQIID
ncbi:MAG TPA: TRAP transporter small permease [Spirochaetales bacterium]|nr:TRAP transporter small permease [Spirochaetales bacterium]HOV38044.1 TRAP transporter small permease [Spirochaetales bacterium]